MVSGRLAQGAAVIYIIASSYDRAQNYARFYSLPRREWCPLDCVEKFWMVPPKSKIVKTNGWFDRLDRDAMDAAAAKKQCVVTVEIIA